MVTVFIPTLGCSPVLADLIVGLVGDPSIEEVVVGDNRTDGVPLACGHPKVSVLDLAGMGLYEMWNQAIASSARRTDTRLAILNDDITLPPSAIGRLAAAMDEHDLTAVCPDYHHTTRTGIEYVTGTYRHGGICGFAFMVDAARCPLIDPRFRLWYGDDDLMWKIDQQGGRMAILRGVHVDHLGSVTIATQPWATEAIAADTALWEGLDRW